MQSIDTVEPGSKWTFNEDVAACFDDMLERSIPQYPVMRSACVDLASHFLKPETDIIDLGCSRGESLRALVNRHWTNNKYIGLEISEPMLVAARASFAKEISDGFVEIRQHDLRTGLPHGFKPTVILSVLTLQFVPIEYRQKILSQVYEMLNPGGAFIVVEKVLGKTTTIDEAMTALYYNLKGANGYSVAAISRKKLALEGVLVPVTAEMNEQFLKTAGFSTVDCFWRWMNFAGWIAVK